MRTIMPEGSFPRIEGDWNFPEKAVCMPDGCLERRRSIRKYKSGRLPGKMIQTLVESAITAPSPSNTQPVRYFHLNSGRSRAFLREDMERGRRSLLERAATADTPRKAGTIIRYYWRFSEFMLGAPELFCVGTVRVSGFCEKLGKTGMDCGISRSSEVDITVGLSVMAFIMKAQSLGLGTCVLTAPLLFTEKWPELPELEGMAPKCFVACGYPDEAPDKTPRKSVGEIYRSI